MYALDDPTAGAYGNPNFKLIEDYMHYEASVGNRSVVFYGEVSRSGRHALVVYMQIWIAPLPITQVVISSALTLLLYHPTPYRPPIG